MSADRIILVAGLGRCGMTAAMSALHAGGAKTIGTKPAFQIEDMRSREPGWFQKHHGHVAKWIDPTFDRIPDGVQATTIWMTREPAEQAHSIVKFCGARAGQHRHNAIEAGIRRDTAKGRQIAAAHGPVLDLQFETMIMTPRLAMSRIHA